MVADAGGEYNAAALRQPRQRGYLPAMNTLHTGRKGEALAARFLQQRGYVILDSNWHCDRGELDLVARKAATYVFVEVRTRNQVNTEEAFASITPRKQARLLAAVWAWLEAHEAAAADWRVDVVAVALGKRPQIEHVEDALDW